MTDLGALEKTLRSTWNFADPDASAVKFADLLDALEDEPAARALVETQIARTQGLSRRFDDAHRTLDAIEERLALLPPGRDATHLRARIAIERGRALNSGGKPAEARPLFEHSLALANEAGRAALAIDAAHMVAIAAGNAGQPADALAWNERALALAESSSDPDARSWRGSLLNNLGWTHHADGRFEKALSCFEAALAAREEQGDPGNVRIARWCVARALRSVGSFDEALAAQQALEKEYAAANAPDGYVFEEVAECFHALGRGGEARPYFARAHEMLAADPWLAENEPDRIRRLKELSQVPV